MAIIGGGDLKTGQRPVRKEERTYRANEDLFREGERGDEFFVLQEGEVAVRKRIEENVVELARLKTGAMIGEMALLDNMPRSATVTAVSLSRVTVINRLVFEAVLAKVPLWLRSIVKIVTSRLRDANTRVGKAILRDQECGFCNMLVHLSHRYAKSGGEYLDYPLHVVRNLTGFTTRMSQRECQSAMDALCQRKLVEIGRDTAGAEHLYIRDMGAVKLFVEYRRLLAQGRTITGADLSDVHHEFLSNVNYVSQKQGRQTPEGVFLAYSAMDFGEDKINRALAKELEKKRVLTLPDAASMGNAEGILYNKNTLTKARKLKEWLPLFTLKITSNGKAAS